MANHTITTESAQRLSRLLAKDKYQPPIRPTLTRPIDQDTPMYRFVLKANMGIASANADISTLDGRDFLTDTPVQNTIGQFGHLTTGASGICIRVGSDFYAIHPEGGAASGDTATFQIGEALEPGGNALSLVLSTNVVPPPTLIRVQSVEQRAPINARGVATFVGGVWVVNEIQQHPLLWTADLTGPTHDFSASVGGGGSIGSAFNLDSTRYTNRQSRTGYPFNLFPPDSGLINNVGNLAGLAGDRMLVSYNATADTHVLIAIFHERAKRFMFKLTADRPASGAMNNINAYAVAPGTSGGLPDGITVHDPYFACVNAKSGATGIAEFNYRLNRYEAIVCTHVATRALAQVAANMTGAKATFTVDRARGLDGDDPTGTITVRNRYKWDKADKDKEIAIEWDHKNNEWVTYQMECPA